MNARSRENSKNLIETQKIASDINQIEEIKELTTFPRATTLRKVAGRREEEVSSGSSSASRDAACFIESES